MVNQENQNNEKSVKQKSPEELMTDIKAMHQYREDQNSLLERGKAAEAELAKRLGAALNEKGGKELLLEKKSLEAIRKATKKQYDPGCDVVLVAVYVDNDHAQNVSQRLNEEVTLSLVHKALEEHLPGGTLSAAVSLKEMQQHNLKLFGDAFGRFKMALTSHNKTTATLIQREYKHAFSYRPGMHLPGE